MGAVLTGLVLLCITGCASKAVSSQKTTVTTATVEATDTAMTYPDTVGTKAAEAWVKVPYREYKTPSATHVEDFGTRVALLGRTLAAPTSLWLLDFKTGACKEVVHDAVNIKNGFTILGDRCSDDWVVWEESNGDNTNSATGVDWKVYAAPIDVESLSIGKPWVVSDRATTVESRPLLSLDGDTLYMMTNGSRDALGRITTFRSRVRAFDLKAHTTRVVYESERHMSSAAIEEGLLMVAEITDDDSPAEVNMIDPASGAVKFSCDLENKPQLSHYPVYHDGKLVWALIDDVRPDIYMRDATGTVTKIAASSSDAVWVHDLLFYEAHPVRSLGTGISAEDSEIQVLDPSTMKYFTLVSDKIDSRSWEAPIGTGSGGGTYVTFKEASIDLVKGTGPTIVRRYEMK